MTQVGSLHNNNNNHHPFSFNPHHNNNNKFDHGNSNSLSQIFHLQLPELITSTQHSRSPASSACPSDDSGIERTLNLSPSSPFPEDTDSDDAQSFAGFEVRRSNSHLQMRQQPLKVGTSYHHHQFGCDVARLSPPGTCAAVVEDTCCPLLASPTLLLKPKVTNSGNRFQILSYEQVTRLHHVLSKTIPIHSRHAGFPTIRVKLNDLFGAVRGNLKAAGIPVRNMRLNGGAASYVIGRENYPAYNDIDVLISVDLTSNSSTIQKVKSAVLNALISFLPDEKLQATSQESNSTVQPQQRSLKFNTLTGSCCNLQSNDDDTANISQDHQSVSTNSSPSNSPVVRIKSHMSSTELRNIDTTMIIKPSCNSNTKEFNDFADSSQCDVVHSSTTVVSTSNNIDCSCSVQPNLVNPPPVMNSSSLPSRQHHHQQQSVVYTSTNSPFITLNVNTLNTIQNCSASTPNGSSPSDGFSLRESYVYKQFRKFSQDDDCWSLLSLGMPSSDSKVIEFKFVDRMKRQFEFTVDSFQIILDPLLSFYECNPSEGGGGGCGRGGITPHFYPTVVAESVAGSFSEALYHLENKLIATIEPEMIRGGGLLKYCRLLVSGYKPAEGVDVHTLEKYMSSRFFIDFQDITSQKVKLEAFLANHFGEHEISVKINYLRILYQVVSGSTICLMSHEHFQTLNLITEMLRYFMYNYYSQFSSSSSNSCSRLSSPPLSLSLEWFAEKQNLVLDKIYFGTQLFPVISRSEPYSNNCYCLKQKNKLSPVIQRNSRVMQKGNCGLQGVKNSLQTASASPSSNETSCCEPGVCNLHQGGGGGGFTNSSTQNSASSINLHDDIQRTE